MWIFLEEFQNRGVVEQRVRHLERFQEVPMIHNVCVRDLQQMRQIYGGAF